MNFAGINLWFPTIGIYGNTLWPSEAVPGYQIGILPPGPATTKEPFKEDVLRLMLQTAEKYGLNVIGDLVLPRQPGLVSGGGGSHVLGQSPHQTRDHRRGNEDDRQSPAADPGAVPVAGLPQPARFAALGLVVTVPAAARERLRAQLEFVERTLSRQPEELEVVAFSPEDLRKAEGSIKAARKCLEKGQTWRARKMLLHSDMIKLHEAFHAYPPGLLNRKTFSLPLGAFKPDALLEKLENRADAQLKPSAKVAPGLAGEQVLVLGVEPPTIKLEVPFTGKYRVRCAFVAGKSFGAPAIHHKGRPIPLIGEQRGTHGGLLVSAPLMLGAGLQKLTLAAAKGRPAGLLGIYLEPVCRDLVAAEFQAIGPFPGYNGWLRGKDVVAKMEEPYFPEDGIHLDKKAELKGGPLSWVTPQVGVQSTDSEALNYICLYQTFGEISVGGKGSISHAYTEVESPSARPAQLNVGVDYWAKIWVNDSDNGCPSPPSVKRHPVLARLPHLTRRFATSYSRMPAATVTFREWAPPYMGMVTISSHRPLASGDSPWVSLPSTTAQGLDRSASQHGCAAAAEVPTIRTDRSLSRARQSWTPCVSPTGTRKTDPVVERTPARA